MTSPSNLEDALKIIENKTKQIHDLQIDLVEARGQLVKGVSSSSHLDKETTKEFKFTPIPEALEAFKKGEFLVVLDNEDRENEGDLILAAECMTPEKMAFMINHTSGVICCAITSERQKELKLPIMVEDNTEKHKTAFTQTLDVIDGTTTGISASDRSKTCQALADPAVGIGHFNRPGHVFPLVSRDGGVIERDGHTEATTDLCKLSGFKAVGCLCEIALKSGDMAKRQHLEGFSAMYGLCMITISDLIKYRKENGL